MAAPGSGRLQYIYTGTPAPQPTRLTHVRLMADLAGLCANVGHGYCDSSGARWATTFEPSSDLAEMQAAHEIVYEGQRVVVLAAQILSGRLWCYEIDGGLTVMFFDEGHRNGSCGDYGGRERRRRRIEAMRRVTGEASKPLGGGIGTFVPLFRFGASSDTPPPI
ncbi:MAG: hypothetical protein JWQ73_3934 [Variovorax sp.]|jgi:hypothetical protein|nr:hypothetical protein [Variovorax sp.]